MREELADREVEVLAPVHETAPRDGKRIPKGEFEINLEAGTVTCPQGEVAGMPRQDPKGERLARFSRYRARKSRYLGTKKAAFQAAWTAVLVNLHPSGAALRTEGS